MNDSFYIAENLKQIYSLISKEMGIYPAVRKVFDIPYSKDLHLLHTKKSWEDKCNNKINRVMDIYCELSLRLYEIAKAKEKEKNPKEGYSAILDKLSNNPEAEKALVKIMINMMDEEQYLEIDRMISGQNVIEE